MEGMSQSEAILEMVREFFQGQREPPAFLPSSRDTAKNGTTKDEATRDGDQP